MLQHRISIELNADELHTLNAITIERVLHTTLTGLGDGTTTETDRAFRDWTENDQALVKLVTKLWLVARRAGRLGPV